MEDYMDLIDRGLEMEDDLARDLHVAELQQELFQLQSTTSFPSHAQEIDCCFRIRDIEEELSNDRER